MGKPLRLLCVDDESNILKVIKRQLIDDDIEFYSASNAAEGLKLLQQLGSVDVIISDYRMPGMNGIEFLKEASLLCPQTHCIILSGFVDIADVQQHEHLFQCQRKPWQAGELRRLILSSAPTDAADSKLSGD